MELNILLEDVVPTLINIYKTEDILHHHLMVEFLGEPGVDAGLTKELFTIFWTSILQNPNYFKGYDIAFPHLPVHLLRKKRIFLPWVEFCATLY